MPHTNFRYCWTSLSLVSRSLSVTHQSSTHLKPTLIFCVHGGSRNHRPDARHVSYDRPQEAAAAYRIKLKADTPSLPRLLLWRCQTSKLVAEDRHRSHSDALAFLLQAASQSVRWEMELKVNPALGCSCSSL